MDSALNTLITALKTIRDHAVSVLKKVEQSVQQRSLAWKCAACGDIKHFTRSALAEVAVPCRKCGGATFYPQLMRFPWPPFRGSAVGANSSVVGRLSRVNLLADYFKTIEEKECKSVTVWRVGHPTAPSVAQASAADAISELSTAAALPDPLNPKRERRLSSPQLN